MAVVMTAILAFGACLWLWPVAVSDGRPVGGTAGVAFWIVVTFVASSFPVLNQRGSVVSVSIAPILAAAMLGGPTVAAVVGFVGTLELRELRGEVPWYGTLYNHCSTLLSASVAGAIYAVVAGPTGSPTTLWTFGVALIAGGAFFVVAEATAAAAVALRQARSYRAVVAGDLRAFGLALVGLAPLAWLMALAYSSNEFGPVVVVVVFALPLYTTRTAYQSVVEIRKMFTQTVLALASAIDARDPSTKKHSQHVSSIAMEIGQEMGVAESQMEQLEWGGLLHDIGKIGIRDAVLLKPDRLNKEERALMNEHPAKGEEILKGVEKLKPELPLIRHHHEWYNGSGYPDKLIGEGIPFLARILHVADAFEAMTAVRPYRLRPLSTAQALEELRKYTGIQFDPRVVDAFARTQSAKGDRVFAPEAAPLPAPIPMLSDLAKRRGQGPVSAAVPYEPR